MNTINPTVTFNTTVTFQIKKEPWSRQRKLVLALSPLILAGLFLLAINVIARITPLDLSIQTEMSADTMQLRWSYQDASAPFHIQRQMQTLNDQWKTDARTEKVTIDQEGYGFSDNTVKSNTTYRYKISTKVQPLGIIPISLPKTTVSPEILTKPSTPKALTPKISANAEIELRWQQPDGANEFQIYRGTAQGDLEPHERLEATKSKSGQYTHKDANLSPNTTYRYALEALNRSGASERTPTVTVLTPPAPPPGLTLADSRAADNVKLSWRYTDNSVRFRVYASPTNDDDAYQLVRDDLPPDTRSIIDRISADRQWYRVGAYNASGVESISEPLPPKPIVKRIDPNQVPEAGGTEITIHGTGFVEDGLRVTIGGNEATFRFDSPLSIRVNTPPGHGRQDVVVTTLYEAFPVSGGLTYIAAPCLVVEPLVLDWGLVAADEQLEMKQATIENGCDGTLQITRIVPKQPWLRVENGEELPLAGGESRHISIYIDKNRLPQEQNRPRPGQHDGAIDIASNGGDKDIRVSVFIAYGYIEIPQADQLPLDTQVTVRLRRGLVKSFPPYPPVPQRILFATNQDIGINIIHNGEVFIDGNNPYQARGTYYLTYIECPEDIPLGSRLQIFRNKILIMSCPLPRDRRIPWLLEAEIEFYSLISLIGSDGQELDKIELLEIGRGNPVLSTDW
jgi:hypothetical protein